MKKTEKINKDLTATFGKESKKQIDKQNQILKYTLLTFGLIILIVITGYMIAESSIEANKYPEYQGVYFTQEKVGELTFYKTSFPIIQDNKKAKYLVYIRNHPEKLSKVKFEGNLTQRKNIVINLLDEFNCNGDGGIGVGNLVMILENRGAKVIKDPNATCDEEGRYTIIQVKKGKETEIIQTGPSCYDMYVKNCEIIKATERYLLEELVAINALINKSSSQNNQSQEQKDTQEQPNL